MRLYVIFPLTSMGVLAPKVAIQRAVAPMAARGGKMLPFSVTSAESFRDVFWMIVLGFWKTLRDLAVAIKSSHFLRSEVTLSLLLLWVSEAICLLSSGLESPGVNGFGGGVRVPFLTPPWRPLITTVTKPPGFIMIEILLLRGSRRPR